MGCLATVGVTTIGSSSSGKSESMKKDTSVPAGFLPRPLEVDGALLLLDLAAFGEAGAAVLPALARVRVATGILPDSTIWVRFLGRCSVRARSR